MKRLLALFIWFGSLAAMIFWLTARVPIQSDLSHFLPVDSDDDGGILITELQKGPASRLILLAIEGADAYGLAKTSRTLAQKMQESGLFSRVENGSQVAQLIYPKLFEYRYLLASVEHSRFLDADWLRNTLEERLSELQAPLPSPFKQIIDKDPTATYQQLLTQWIPSQRPVTREGVWFSGDGKRALLVAETSADGLDLNEQRKAVVLIEESFHTIDPENNQRLRISGPGVFAAQSREIIRADARRLSIISSLVVIGLLLVTYRSLSLLLYLLIPLSSAFITGAAATGIVFGELHGITLAFGITLLGVTIDYPIHLFSHLRAGEPPTGSVLRIWRPLSLGVLTTSIGYLVLVTTDFNGLRQLGVFTIGGLLAAAAVTRWLLPQLVPSKRTGLRLQGMARWIHNIRAPRAARQALVFFAVVAAVFALNRSGEIWQDDLASLSPLPPALPDLDRELRQQLRAPEINQMIIGKIDSVESALQISEALEEGLLQQLVEDKIIEGFDDASRYLPSEHRQRERQALLPSGKEIQGPLEIAAQGLPFRTAVFRPFLDAVDKSHDLPPITLDDLEDTPPGRRLSALLRRHEKSWILLIPLRGVNDASELAERLTTHLPPGIRYMDLKTETEELVMGFRKGIAERLVWGVLSMLLILALGLRSLPRTVASLAPAAVALPLTVMILHVFGTPLTLFHLVSLMLVVGIGIDYSLFLNRSTDSKEEIETLHSLTVCFLSTFAVFTTLGTSQIPVLEAIGQTVAVGVTITFAAAFVLRQRMDSETA